MSRRDRVLWWVPRSLLVMGIFSVVLWWWFAGPPSTIRRPPEPPKELEPASEAALCLDPQDPALDAIEAAFGNPRYPVTEEAYSPLLNAVLQRIERRIVPVDDPSNQGAYDREAIAESIVSEIVDELSTDPDMLAKLLVWRRLLLQKMVEDHYSPSATRPRTSVMWARESFKEESIPTRQVPERSLILMALGSLALSEALVDMDCEPWHEDFQARFLPGEPGVGATNEDLIEAANRLLGETRDGRTIYGASPGLIDLVITARQQPPDPVLQPLLFVLGKAVWVRWQEDPPNGENYLCFPKGQGENPPEVMQLRQDFQGVWEGVFEQFNELTEADVHRGMRNRFTHFAEEYERLRGTHKHGQPGLLSLYVEHLRQQEKTRWPRLKPFFDNGRDTETREFIVAILPKDLSNLPHNEARSARAKPLEDGSAEGAASGNLPLRTRRREAFRMEVRTAFSQRVGLQVDENDHPWFDFEVQKQLNEEKEAVRERQAGLVSLLSPRARFLLGIKPGTAPDVPVVRAAAREIVQLRATRRRIVQRAHRLDAIGLSGLVFQPTARGNLVPAGKKGEKKLAVRGSLRFMLDERGDADHASEAEAAPAETVASPPDSGSAEKNVDPEAAPAGSEPNPATELAPAEILSANAIFDYAADPPVVTSLMDVGPLAEDRSCRWYLETYFGETLKCSKSIAGMASLLKLQSAEFIAATDANGQESDQRHLGDSPATVRLRFASDLASSTSATPVSLVIDLPLDDGDLKSTWRDAAEQAVSSTQWQESLKAAILERCRGAFEPIWGTEITPEVIFEEISNGQVPVRWQSRRLWFRPSMQQRVVFVPHTFIDGNVPAMFRSLPDGLSINRAELEGSRLRGEVCINLATGEQVTPTPWRVASLEVDLVDNVWGQFDLGRIEPAAGTDAYMPLGGGLAVRVLDLRWSPAASLTIEGEVQAGKHKLPIRIELQRQEDNTWRIAKAESMPARWHTLVQTDVVPDGQAWADITVTEGSIEIPHPQGGPALLLRGDQLFRRQAEDWVAIATDDLAAPTAEEIRKAIEAIKDLRLFGDRFGLDADRPAADGLPRQLTVRALVDGATHVEVSAVIPIRWYRDGQGTWLAEPMTDGCRLAVQHPDALGEQLGFPAGFFQVEEATGTRGGWRVRCSCRLFHGTTDVIITSDDLKDPVRFRRTALEQLLRAMPRQVAISTDVGTLRLRDFRVDTKGTLRANTVLELALDEPVAVSGELVVNTNGIRIERAKIEDNDRFLARIRRLLPPELLSASLNSSALEEVVLFWSEFGLRAEFAVRFADLKDPTLAVSIRDAGVRFVFDETGLRAKPQGKVSLDVKDDFEARLKQLAKATNDEAVFRALLANQIFKLRGGIPAHVVRVIPADHQAAHLLAEARDRGNGQFANDSPGQTAYLAWNHLLRRIWLTTNVKPYEKDDGAPETYYVRFFAEVDEQCPQIASRIRTLKQQVDLAADDSKPDSDRITAMQNAVAKATELNETVTLQLWENAADRGVGATASPEASMGRKLSTEFYHLMRTQCGLQSDLAREDVFRVVELRYGFPVEELEGWFSAADQISVEDSRSLIKWENALLRTPRSGLGTVRFDAAVRLGTVDIVLPGCRVTANFPTPRQRSGGERESEDADTTHPGVTAVALPAAVRWQLVIDGTPCHLDRLSPNDLLTVFEGMLPPEAKTLIEDAPELLATEFNAQRSSTFDDVLRAEYRLQWDVYCLPPGVGTEAHRIGSIVFDDRGVSVEDLDATGLRDELAQTALAQAQKWIDQLTDDVKLGPLTLSELKAHFDHETMRARISAKVTLTVGGSSLSGTAENIHLTKSHDRPLDMSAARVTVDTEQLEAILGSLETGWVGGLLHVVGIENAELMSPQTRRQDDGTEETTVRVRLGLILQSKLEDNPGVIRAAVAIDENGHVELIDTNLDQVVARQLAGRQMYAVGMVFQLVGVRTSPDDGGVLDMDVSVQGGLLDSPLLFTVRWSRGGPTLTDEFRAALVGRISETITIPGADDALAKLRKQMGEYGIQIDIEPVDGVQPPSDLTGWAALLYFHYRGTLGASTHCPAEIRDALGNEPLGSIDIRGPPLRVELASNLDLKELLREKVTDEVLDRLSAEVDQRLADLKAQIEGLIADQSILGFQAKLVAPVQIEKTGSGTGLQVKPFSVELDGHGMQLVVENVGFRLDCGLDFTGATVKGDLKDAIRRQLPFADHLVVHRAVVRNGKCYFDFDIEVLDLKLSARDIVVPLSDSGDLAKNIAGSVTASCNRRVETEMGGCVRVTLDPRLTWAGKANAQLDADFEVSVMGVPIPGTLTLTADGVLKVKAGDLSHVAGSLFKKFVLDDLGDLFPWKSDAIKNPELTWSGTPGASLPNGLIFDVELPIECFSEGVYLKVAKIGFTSQGLREPDVLRVTLEEGVSATLFDVFEVQELDFQVNRRENFIGGKIRMTMGGSFEIFGGLTMPTKGCGRFAIAGSANLMGLDFGSIDCTIDRARHEFMLDVLFSIGGGIQYMGGVTLNYEDQIIGGHGGAKVLGVTMFQASMLFKLKIDDYYIDGVIALPLGEYGGSVHIVRGGEDIEVGARFPWPTPIGVFQISILAGLNKVDVGVKYLFLPTITFRFPSFNTIDGDAIMTAIENMLNPMRWLQALMNFRLPIVIAPFASPGKGDGATGDGGENGGENGSGNDGDDGGDKAGEDGGEKGKKNGQSDQPPPGGKGPTEEDEKGAEKPGQKPPMPPKIPGRPHVKTKPSSEPSSSSEKGRTWGQGGSEEGVRFDWNDSDSSAWICYRPKTGKEYFRVPKPWLDSRDDRILIKSLGHVGDKQAGAALFQATGGPYEGKLVYRSCAGGQDPQDLVMERNVAPEWDATKDQLDTWFPLVTKDRATEELVRNRLLDAAKRVDGEYVCVLYASDDGLPIVVAIQRRKSAGRDSLRQSAVLMVLRNDRTGYEDPHLDRLFLRADPNWEGSLEWFQAKQNKDLVVALAKEIREKGYRSRDADKSVFVTSASGDKPQEWLHLRYDKNKPGRATCYHTTLDAKVLSLTPPQRAAMSRWFAAVAPSWHGEGNETGGPLRTVNLVIQRELAGEMLILQFRKTEDSAEADTLAITSQGDAFWLEEDGKTLIADESRLPRVEKRLTKSADYFDNLLLPSADRGDAEAAKAFLKSLHEFAIEHTGSWEIVYLSDASDTTQKLHSIVRWRFADHFLYGGDKVVWKPLGYHPVLIGLLQDTWWKDDKPSEHFNTFVKDAMDVQPGKTALLKIASSGTNDELRYAYLFGPLDNQPQRDLWGRVHMKTATWSGRFRENWGTVRSRGQAESIGAFSAGYSPREFARDWVIAWLDKQYRPEGWREPDRLRGFLERDSSTP